MIELDSDVWGELDHAYGKASDIPGLLWQLYDYPEADDPNAEPFFSLWSTLCHQGNCYSASYASVPHLIQAATSGLDQISYEYILLPTAIEVARTSGKGPDLHEELAPSYLEAMRALPGIVSAIVNPDQNETWAITAAAAIAVSSGHPKLADAILTLEGNAIDEYLEWIEDR